jgi:sec-independent protein translocase protein TatA
MFGIGIPELLIIVLVFGVLFFGSAKITEFARSLGRASGEFKKGKEDIEREIREGMGEAGKEDKKIDNTK